MLVRECAEDIPSYMLMMCANSGRVLFYLKNSDGV